MNKRSKILCISNHSIFPPTTWWSRLIYNFLKFSSKNNEIVFINEKNHSTYINDLKKVETHEIIKTGKRKFFDIFLIKKIYNILKVKKINTVVIEYPWFWIHFYVLKRVLWIKIILQEHNIEFLRFKSNWYWWWKILFYYEKWVYKIVDDVFFISKSDQKLAQKYFWISKWEIIEYWVDTDVFNHKFNTEKKKFLEKKHNIPKDTIIISFIWKLDYKPNSEALDYIIKDIYPDLKSSGQKFKIIINGAPIPKWPITTEYPHIIFTGNVVNITDYIKWCDIVINPISSGWWVKTKVIESLACWKTVISTPKWAEWINPITTEWKLILSTENNWTWFTQLIVEHLNVPDYVSPDFTKQYSLDIIFSKLNFNNVK